MLLMFLVGNWQLLCRRLEVVLGREFPDGPLESRQGDDADFYFVGDFNFSRNV
jgi:hypothetical protein